MAGGRVMAEWSARVCSLLFVIMAGSMMGNCVQAVDIEFTNKLTSGGSLKVAFKNSATGQLVAISNSLSVGDSYHLQFDQPGNERKLLQTTIIIIIIWRNDSVAPSAEFTVWNGSSGLPGGRCTECRWEARDDGFYFATEGNQPSYQLGASWITKT